MAKLKELEVENIQHDEEISDQELYDVLTFANSLYNYKIASSPLLINERMKDINLNPLQSEEDALDRAMANPKNSEKELIGYSEFFELTSMLYKRLMNYMSNLLSFDIRDIVCYNAELGDYNKKEYKKDYKIVCDFIDKFDIKQEFTKVMRESMRQDATFWVFRRDAMKYTLQELPQDYCLITGKWDYGILFDFDMTWFLQTGVSLDMYPSVFKEMYKDTFFDAQGNYNPANSYRNGKYGMYVQTNPRNGFWCWKLQPELATRIPFFAPLFQDVALLPLKRKLQKNKDIIACTKIMVGLIPMLNNPKGGNVKDMVALDADTAGKFLGLLKNAIGDVIKTGAVPFSDVKTLDFDFNNSKNILDDYAKTTASMSGVNTRLIFDGSEKLNVMETQLSVDMDVMAVEYMYKYFELFLEYYINGLTKKYKFKIYLGGNNTFLDKDRRMDEFLKYSSVGVVMPDRLAYALQIPPHHLMKSLEKTKATGFSDLLTPMLNIYTNSDKNNGVDDGKGAPKKDSSDLKDSGATSREYQ